MNQNLKSIILVILCLFIMPFISACEVSKQREDNIYIFYTSDVHCGVDENVGMAGLKALINDTKAEHELVSLVDVGDFSQGATLGSLTKGEAIIRIMNAMEYDICTFGNHEFDYGLDQLQKLIAMSDFEYVLCNANYTGHKTSIFKDIPPYIIKDYDGTKVAFIGVLTPETNISSTPSFFMEDGEMVYTFYPGEEGMNLANQVQVAVDAARKEGADYVVALTHIGSVDTPHDSISLIHHTSGIDVVLDGHSHSVIIGDAYPNKDGEDVILSSVGTKMENIGELIIEPDGTMTTLLISEYDKKDEEIAKVITDEQAELEEILSEKITTIDYDLKIVDEDGIRISRSRETNMGDLIADAFRYVAQTDIGFVNGGGVRQNIMKGEVTLGDLLEVQPFQDALASCYATGQQILDALEFGGRNAERITSFDGNAVGECGGFLQASGLKYTIDTSIPSPIKLDENEFFVGIEGERRIKDVYVLQGEEYVPIDPNQTYTVSCTDYILFHSGGGNTIFKDCKKIIASGMADVDALKQYMMECSDQLDQYKETQGRITIE